jgi:integrase
MAGKYQRGRQWYLSWVEDGRQIRRSLGAVTETEAEAARLAHEARSDVLAAAGPLFGDWASRYATWHSQEYPDSYYRVEQILRCHLIPCFGATPLLAISRAQVEAYKAGRLDAAAAGTVVKELRTLQACLNAAVAWDIIPRNPVARVRAPRDLASRPPRWYSLEELALIYATELSIPACTTSGDADLHRRYRWSWQLLANTGLRRTEGLQLQWRDVGREEIGVRSEDGARTKSGHWRAIPISRGAGEALEALATATRPRLGYVLPQVAQTSLSRAFVRTLGRCDLDGHIHCLRHTYCSHLVQAGVPLRTVQVLAGHASSRTTERYAHLAPSILREAIAGMAL